MEEAISNLTLESNPEDSVTALYLVSAPSKEMTMDLIKELGDYLSELAPKAIIRYGDYPREGSELKITVVLSQLNHVSKVRDYYDKIPELLQERKMRQDENESKLKELTSASMIVPSLFRVQGNGD